MRLTVLFFNHAIETQDLESTVESFVEQGLSSLTIDQKRELT